MWCSSRARTGGATAAWIDENTAITPADPTSNQVTLTAKKVSGAVVIASELLQDSIASIADWVAAELALSLSNAIETAAFSGNPSNAPGVARASWRPTRAACSHRLVPPTPRPS